MPMTLFCYMHGDAGCWFLDTRLNCGSNQFLKIPVSRQRVTDDSFWFYIDFSIPAGHDSTTLHEL